MNLQQTVQKPSANGHARRRGDRDVGARMENKFHSGKSYSHKSAPVGSMTGKKVGSSGSPLRDRLVYLTTCLIGHHVEVQVKNGSIYTGIFHATDAENDFGVILRMARLTKDTTPGQKALAESISKAPSKTFIIPAKELVQVIAKDVAVTRDGLLSEVQHEKQQDLMLDCSISQSRHAEGERELEPWVPDEDDPQCPELDDIFDGHWNRSWDQFQTNEMLFGVKSTFNEELYTTKLDRGPQTRELEREALRIAREIEGEDTQDLHLAEERGVYLHDKFDIDEETRFSSVYRGKVDDSGYEETEDIMFDTHNDETFGGSSDPTIQSSTDMSHGGHNDDAQASSSSSSLDQAQLSQSSVHLDMGCSSSYDHAKQQASESPLKNESRIQENVLTDKHEAEKNSESIKKLTEADNCILLTSEDSQSSLSGRKDGSDLEGLSRNSPSYAPSCTSRKVNEKSSLAELVEGSTSGKAHGEIQTWNNRGRPGSSASSNSDGVIASASAAAATAAAAAAAAAIGPGLSPSTSMGSLSPEKSTLNPYAKEFKLNPNAKSFTPSKTPTRSPSPASDGSFYYQNNTAAISQMHAMPFGVGIGPAFAGQQPVIFNSHVPPMQSPQPYFQPNGPQYGQPMLLGHPRQVVYMPGYPPEMQYKGREY